MIDKMLIIKFFLQGVPEAAAVLFSCFAMVGYKAKAKELLPWAVSVALIIYILRIIMGPTGVYSLVGLILLVMVLKKVTQISMIRAFLSTLTVYFVLAVVEFIVIKIMNILFNYQTSYLPTSSDWLWIISGWPQVIIMFIFGHCLYKYFRPCCFIDSQR